MQEPVLYPVSLLDTPYGSCMLELIPQSTFGIAMTLFITALLSLAILATLMALAMIWAPRPTSSSQASVSPCKRQGYCHDLAGDRYAEADLRDRKAA